MAFWFLFLVPKGSERACVPLAPTPPIDSAISPICTLSHSSPCTSRSPSFRGFSVQVQVDFYQIFTITPESGASSQGLTFLSFPAHSDGCVLRHGPLPVPENNNSWINVYISQLGGRDKESAKPSIQLSKLSRCTRRNLNGPQTMEDGGIGLRDLKI